jgi:hypothetical protein
METVGDLADDEAALQDSTGLAKGRSQEWLRYGKRGRGSGLVCRGAAEALLEGAVEAVADALGEGQGFGVAEDFDGFPRGVDQQAAIVAVAQMSLDLLDGAPVQLAVEKIAEFRQNRFTVRFLAAHF